MYKKVIEYTDYNGETRKDTFYFNLSKAEVAEMELSTNGGLEKQIQSIIDAKDQKEIVATFKEIILKAYGEKSLDGKYFLKKDENGRPLADKFEQTEAYSELFIELATNADKAQEFVNGIVPKFEDNGEVKRIANTIAIN